MPIRFEKTTAFLENVCTVEEAETLLAWVRGRKRPKIDLKACEHLHTAILQVLLVVRPAVTAWPEDAELRRWVAAVLPQAEAAE